MFIIRVEARHGHLGVNGNASEIIMNGFLFSTKVNFNDSHGIIGFWEFTDNFLKYPGNKIFYCCEPSFYFHGQRASKRILRRQIASLRADEFAWHACDSEMMKVFHHTKSFRSEENHCGDRMPTAAAVVSNLGNWLTRGKGRRRRIKFLLESGCDIFGRERTWRSLKSSIRNFFYLPKTYRGECFSKLKTLSQYHACVCLENASEPFYFTEKFIDAVRAGCVPIYHAHYTVRDTFLKDAFYIDPADFAWDGRATLQAALITKREEVLKLNLNWLRSNPYAKLSSLEEVYNKLAECLFKKASGEIDLPDAAHRPLFLDD